MDFAFLSEVGFNDFYDPCLGFGSSDLVLFLLLDSTIVDEVSFSSDSGVISSIALHSVLTTPCLGRGPSPTAEGHARFPILQDLQSRLERDHESISCHGFRGASLEVLSIFLKELHV
ncbi:hypothetical protein WA026_017693 [Henosepilachna vigintioctopunctata]|uniref:Uncharacterized protein n=1 Tax=Henosepilachna vigintioctopunctata TaxID=420089 RepID=A0AAW1U0E3_9CUCU